MKNLAMRRTKLSFQSETKDGVQTDTTTKDGNWEDSVEKELVQLRNKILTLKGVLGNQTASVGLPYSSVWSAIRCLTAEDNATRKDFSSASK